MKDRFIWLAVWFFFVLAVAGLMGRGSAHALVITEECGDGEGACWNGITCAGERVEGFCDSLGGNQWNCPGSVGCDPGQTGGFRQIGVGGCKAYPGSSVDPVEEPPVEEPPVEEPPVEEPPVEEPPVEEPPVEEPPVEEPPVEEPPVEEPPVEEPPVEEPPVEEPPVEEPPVEEPPVEEPPVEEPPVEEPPVEEPPVANESPTSGNDRRGQGGNGGGYGGGGGGGGGGGAPPRSVRCWDGSRAESRRDCPVANCWDGSTARTPKGCPVQFSLDRPREGDFLGGITAIGGWICEANYTSFWARSVGDPRWMKFRVPYGGSRADTEEICGDSDNGFGMEVNWNLFGDGPVEVWFGSNGKGRKRFVVTVVTLGEEFVEDASQEVYTLQDFPSEGEVVDLQWNEQLQNFMIVDMGEYGQGGSAGKE